MFPELPAAPAGHQWSPHVFEVVERVAALAIHASDALGKDASLDHLRYHVSNLKDAAAPLIKALRNHAAVEDVLFPDAWVNDVAGLVDDLVARLQDAERTAGERCAICTYSQSLSHCNPAMSVVFDISNLSDSSRPERGEGRRRRLISISLRNCCLPSVEATLPPYPGVSTSAVPPSTRPSRNTALTGASARCLTNSWMPFAASTSYTCVALALLIRMLFQIPTGQASCWTEVSCRLCTRGEKFAHPA